MPVNHANIFLPRSCSFFVPFQPAKFPKPKTKALQLSAPTGAGRKRKARSDKSQSLRNKSRKSLELPSLDEVRKAAIQRAKARTVINIHGPDPEQESPPGETEDERRRRKERINGRRKRAKKIIEIEQLDYQVMDLNGRNETLKAENEAFRKRLAEAESILEQGGTLTAEFLCLAPEEETVEEQEDDQEETKMPATTERKEEAKAFESKSSAPIHVPTASDHGLANRMLCPLGPGSIVGQSMSVAPFTFGQIDQEEQALLGSLMNMQHARQANPVQSVPISVLVGLQQQQQQQQLSLQQQQLAQLLPQGQAQSLSQLPPQMRAQLLQVQLNQPQRHPRFLQQPQTASHPQRDHDTLLQRLRGNNLNVMGAGGHIWPLLRTQRQHRPDAPEEGKR